MTKDPSYEELRETDHFWLQLVPHVAGMNETLDGGLGDNPISSSTYYEANVTAIDAGHSFPHKQIYISAVERREDEIQSLSGKYPIGFIRFNKDGPSVTLICRAELVTRMVATLGMVKSKEIEFFITLPILPSGAFGIYPVLSYQYRVKSG